MNKYETLKDYPRYKINPMTAVVCEKITNKKMRTRMHRGNKCIYLDGYVSLAELVWQQVHEYSPTDIKFKDNDPSNCTIDNLYDGDELEDTQEWADMIEWFVENAPDDIAPDVMEFYEDEYIRLFQ